MLSIEGNSASCCCMKNHVLFVVLQLKFHQVHARRRQRKLASTSRTCFESGAIPIPVGRPEVETAIMSQTRSRSKSSVCGVTLEMLSSSLIASRSLRCTVASPSLVHAVPCHRPRSLVAEACVSAAFVARLERMFSACVCLFPAFVDCFHGSHAASSFTVTSLTFLNAMEMPRHSAPSQC